MTSECVWQLHYWKLLQTLLRCWIQTYLDRRWKLHFWVFSGVKIIRMLPSNDHSAGECFELSFLASGQDPGSVIMHFTMKFPCPECIFARHAFLKFSKKLWETNVLKNPSQIWELYESLWQLWHVDTISPVITLRTSHRSHLMPEPELRYFFSRVPAVLMTCFWWNRKTILTCRFFYFYSLTPHWPKQHGLGAGLLVQKVIKIIMACWRN